MKDHISRNANVRTDERAGYKGLEKEFPHIVREKLEKKEKNFADLHWCIMMFKAWLTGVHHSVKYLQSYLDEYTYRFHRHKMKEGIFENLMARIVEKPPLLKGDFQKNDIYKEKITFSSYHPSYLFS